MQESDPKTSDKKSFTGRQRRHVNRWSVKFADSVARVLITVGGIGTIVAVSTVFIFLLWVVIPLFSSTKIEVDKAPLVANLSGRPLDMGLDDYGECLWTLEDEGNWKVFLRGADSVYGVYQVVEDKLRTVSRWPTPIANDSASISTHRYPMAIGAESGKVYLGKVGFQNEVMAITAAPDIARHLEVGASAGDDEAIYNRVRIDKVRKQVPIPTTFDPIEVSEEPIRAIDLFFELRDSATQSSEATIPVVTESGKLYLIKSEERTTFSGDFSRDDKVTLLKSPYSKESPADFVFVGEGGTNLILLWKDGEVARLKLNDTNEPELLEQSKLPADAPITSAMMLQTRATLVTGDERGRARFWFPVAGTNKDDAAKLALIHEIQGEASPIRCFARSNAIRVLVAGHENGHVDAMHSTTQRVIASARIGEKPVRVLCLSPRDDRFAGVVDQVAQGARLDLRHPEASLSSLFLPVWYEGYSRPIQMWQSGTGVDAPEPKLGLMALVFGTLKGTLYSMLFGSPLAVLAAIYTSEFMRPSVKAPIKGAIEMMSSLPSVVLGFVGALVLAPIIESQIVVVGAAIFFTPVLCMFAAHAWQIAPTTFRIRTARFRWVVIAVLIPLGFLFSYWSAPFLESVLFQGDVRRWLSGQTGSGWIGWFLILLPVSVIGTFLIAISHINRILRERFNYLNASAFAVLDTVKFAGVVLIGALVALALALVLGGIGFDPRGALIDDYIRKNAFIVGVMIGFAIIPIIYTLSEDALSTVPNHLRTASLGSGATPWQTAVRVVLPTAMSGLFSAQMIGLGRAVGETMVVLMCAGNTPVFDVNPFNGFRSLSANIAEELPDAMQGSTHYRVLFLSAVVLFLFTFTLNTLAELVRMRFRKRAHQL